MVLDIAVLQLKDGGVYCCFTVRKQMVTEIVVL